MKRKITFALLCILISLLGISCKKIDNSPLAMTSVVPINSAVFQSSGRIKITWSSFGSTKKSKVKFFLALYYKEKGYERFLREVYLIPDNKTDPEQFPYLTNNDSKEEFQITLGPEFLYKNGYFKLRGQIFNERDTKSAVGDTYWTIDGEINTFKIFHNGCTTDDPKKGSAIPGVSCAITGIPTPGR